MTRYGKTDFPCASYFPRTQKRNPLLGARFPKSSRAVATGEKFAHHPRATVGNKIVTLLNLKGATGIIELNFSRVTFGPNPREPRLIWAEGSTTPQLLKLKSSLDVALGREPDPRPFKLHLTLARFRPENFHSCQSKTLNEAVAWRDTATSFVLMESHLLAGGADYEVLAEIPL